MGIKKPESTETLYVRIKKSNKRFLVKEAKKYGFPSVAKYMDFSNPGFLRSAFIRFTQMSRLDL